MSEITGQQEFSMKFYEVQTFSVSYQALFVIRTDGSAWENYAFESIADNYNLELTGSIPDPDSDGLYTLDFYFTDLGLRVKIMNEEVLFINSTELAIEIEEWDDLGLNFDQDLPETLTIQVSYMSIWTDNHHYVSEFRLLTN